MRLNFLERSIGDEHPCYIIAEMSANHAGDFQRAVEIVRAAKEAGADCIKVQTYTPDTMTIDCDNPYFQITEGTWKGENLYSLYGKAYTPWEWQARLKDEAERLGLHFLSTPFDATAVDFLEDIGVGFYKIASFEITDIPLLRYTASKGKPIILSTGMSSLGEIESALKVIRSVGNTQVALLKCSSAYPAVPEDMNLSSIPVMKQLFGTVIGLSDHSMGSIGAVTAVALGAKIIEKHFCISREIENPDASFSMEAHEFKQMVEDIRAAEKALGQVQFGVTKTEKDSVVFRRSIFAVKDIAVGDSLTSENIRIMRPGYGMAPGHYDELIGRVARREIRRGTPLDWSLIE